MSALHVVQAPLIALRPRECCGLIAVIRARLIHLSRRASYGVSSGRISVPSHGIHLNLWAFPLFLGLSRAGRSSRFRRLVVAKRTRYLAPGLDSSAPIDDLDLSLCEVTFRSRRKNMYILCKIISRCAGTRFRTASSCQGSAPRV